MSSTHSDPVHGSALVQRVVTVAQRLGDVFQTAAFQVGHAVGVGDQHERAEHIQTVGAGGIDPDNGLAGLDEADVAQLADLAAEHGVRVGVLVHLNELLAGLQVVGSVGVDDGNVAVADGVGVPRAQLGRRLKEQLRGQGAGLVQHQEAGNGSLGAVCEPAGAQTSHRCRPPGHGG
jgi:hypothetical protein